MIGCCFARLNERVQTVHGHIQSNEQFLLLSHSEYYVYHLQIDCDTNFSHAIKQVKG